MSLSGIATSNAQAPTAIGANTTPRTATGGGLAFPGQQAAFPGGAMAQGGSGGILKKVLIGGVAGAGVGAGYGLLAGMVSFLPHITIPMGAAIGAASGAALGLVKGLLDKRKSTLAMRAQAQPMPAASAPIPRPLPGRTYAVGTTGAQVKWTQRALKRVGVYQGRISGRFDETTAAAIRRYEVLKGALPTGSSSPDLRAALAQDVKLQQRFA